MKKWIIFCLFLLLTITACKDKKEKVVENLNLEAYEGAWNLKDKYINGQPQEKKEVVLTIQAASFDMESNCRILGGALIQDGGMVVDVKKSSCPIQEAYVGEKIPYTYKISDDKKTMTMWTAKNRNELMYIFERK